MNCANAIWSQTKDTKNMKIIKSNSIDLRFDPNPKSDVAITRYRISVFHTMRKRWEEENLLVLVKSDPDMNFVHGLPEGESSQCHPKVGQHLHHLPLFRCFFDNKSRRSIGKKPWMVLRGNDLVRKDAPNYCVTIWTL